MSSNSPLAYSNINSIITIHPKIKIRKVWNFYQDFLLKKKLNVNRDKIRQFLIRFQKEYIFTKIMLRDLWEDILFGFSLSFWNNVEMIDKVFSVCDVWRFQRDPEKIIVRTCNRIGNDHTTILRSQPKKCITE